MKLPKSPLGMARSDSGNQHVKDLTVHGKMPAWPTPLMNHSTYSVSGLRATPINPVASDQIRTKRVKASRVPRRSPSQPPIA